MPHSKTDRRTRQDRNNRDNTLVPTEDDCPFRRCYEFRLAQILIILAFSVLVLNVALAIDSISMNKPFYPSHCYMRICWVVATALFGLGIFYNLKSIHNVNRNEYEKNGRYIVLSRAGRYYTTSRAEYLITMLPSLIALALCFYGASTALSDIFIMCL